MLENGDCLDWLKNALPESVDMIYLDPPFYTQRSHKLSTKGGGQHYEFDDNWDSIEDYIEFLTVRFVEMRRVLKSTGSIYVHCDKSASHYIRVALDKVFGTDNFRSEIIWAYKRWSNSKKGLLNSHQNIYFYSKSSAFKFNQVFDDYSSTTNIDQIFQKRQRDLNGKTKYKIAESGGYEILDSKKGVPLSDVWNIPYLNPKARERVGYPTQKPILLLERIINLSTDTGDIVLDPFCGSGTTLVASKLLERQYIGIDVSLDAIKLAEQRIKNPIRSESQLLIKGVEAYQNVSDAMRQLLSSLHIQPVERNKGIDGFAKIDNHIKPIPVKIQSESESLEEAQSKILKAAKKNGFKKLMIISTSELNLDMLELGDVLLAVCHRKNYTEVLKRLAEPVV